MALYSYKCLKCKNIIELIQKVGDLPPLCFCESGDPVEMTKDITGARVSLDFRGSGWTTRPLGGK